MELREKYNARSELDLNDAAKLLTIFPDVKNDILTEAVVCSEEEVVQLAGLLIQSNYGDHDPSRHKPGLHDDLKTILPVEYARVRGIEAKALEAHAARAGMSKDDARSEFVRKALEVETWGHACFPIQIADSSKKKKAEDLDRILAINPDAVVLIDGDTKMSLKEWPISTIRRWAAPSGTLTVDFSSGGDGDGGGGDGGAGDSRVSWQAEKADEISELLAGFITLQLATKPKPTAAAAPQKHPKDKKRWSTATPAEDADAAAAVAAAEVAKAAASSPTKGPKDKTRWASAGGGSSSLPARPPKLGTPAKAPKSKTRWATPGKGNGSGGGDGEDAGASLGEALKLTLAGAVEIATSLMKHPELPADAGKKKWAEKAKGDAQEGVLTHCTAISSALASIVALSTGPPGVAWQPDKATLRACVGATHTHLANLAPHTIMLASLAPTMALTMNLLVSSRKLCGTVVEVVRAMSPLLAGKPASDVAASATRSGGIVATLLEYAEVSTGMTRESQSKLVKAALKVRGYASYLAAPAKAAAGTSTDVAIQTGTAVALKSVGMAVTQLVSCTKIVAPTVASVPCIEQAVASAKLVTSCVHSLCSVASGSTPELKQKLNTEASKALDAVVAFERLACALVLSSDLVAKYSKLCSGVTNAAGEIFAAKGQPIEMVSKATLLAKAILALANKVKKDNAKEKDELKQSRLVWGLERATAGTTSLVAAARAVAKGGDSSGLLDPSAQEQLVRVGASLAGIAAAPHSVRAAFTDHL